MPASLRCSTRWVPWVQLHASRVVVCSHDYLCQKCSFILTVISINIKLIQIFLKALQPILTQSQVCDRFVFRTHTQDCFFPGRTFSEMNSFPLCSLVSLSSELDQLPIPSKEKLGLGCRLVGIRPFGFLGGTVTLGTASLTINTFPALPFTSEPGSVNPSTTIY